MCRYGDDAHLDTTVQALGLVMPNKEFPQLKYLKQVGHRGLWSGVEGSRAAWVVWVAQRGTGR